MKKILIAILVCLFPTFLFASSVLIEGFEYANHDMTTPIGWISDDGSWLCGYLEKDHNRAPHTGNWYAFTNADDSWMFMDMFTGSDLRYRYYFWGISDGVFDVELWIGSGASANQMTQRLYTTTVSSGEYELFSEYVQSITQDCRYFGIHATAHEGAYHLTIDDIFIDMVDRYDLDVTPLEWDTVMFAGDEITIEYDVTNTGYEDLHVYMTPHTQTFSNVSFTEDNFSYANFPTVPTQTVHCTCTSTLDPDLAPGTRCYLDIVFSVSCDCLTRMATLWVTVVDSSDLEECADNENVQQVEVFDLTGKKVDPSNLKAGIYIERTITEKGVTTRKFVKK